MPWNRGRAGSSPPSSPRTGPADAGLELAEALIGLSHPASVDEDEAPASGLHHRSRGRPPRGASGQVDDPESFLREPAERPSGVEDVHHGGALGLDRKPLPAGTGLASSLTQRWRLGISKADQVTACARGPLPAGDRDRQVGRVVDPSEVDDDLVEGERDPDPPLRPARLELGSGQVAGALEVRGTLSPPGAGAT
jgi:hypothetical protein